MSLLLIAVITILGIILGKFLFKKWMNHLTIYSLIMGGQTFLYQLKLLPYVNVIPLSWFFLIGSFISLVLGILTYISAKKLYSVKEVFTKQSIIDLPIFADDGKALKYTIIFFIIVSFFVAIQRWVVLIHMFGSIPAVIINAGVVYRLNVNREIKEFLPILPNFIYVGVFLVGIYSAYKRKFTLLTFLPFISIVIKELTYFGRGEILFALLEFLFTFFLFRHLLNDEPSGKYKFSKSNAIIASTILMSFLIISVSLVRITRGNYENYVGASPGLSKLKNNFIISPSIYLYLSSNVGVFSEYLASGGEKTKFGQNTFLLFYDFLAQVEREPRPKFFQRGYYIPMWTNTGTYLRELHADFGIAGIFLVPYLLGLVITWLWYKFYEGHSLIVLAFLVYLYLIIGHSFLMMITRLNLWYFSLFLLILFIPVLERIALRGKKQSIEEGIIGRA